MGPSAPKNGAPQDDKLSGWQVWLGGSALGSRGRAHSRRSDDYFGGGEDGASWREGKVGEAAGFGQGAGVPVAGAAGGGGDGGTRGCNAGGGRGRRLRHSNSRAALGRTAGGGCPHIPIRQGGEGCATRRWR